MTSARIVIAPYDQAWPAAFEREKRILDALLGPWLVGAIEHVGSTAVPGLAAKPITDIMAPVASLAASRGAIEAVKGAAYCYFPYRADVMHWFCKPNDEVRTHHLHIVPYGSPLWRERLAFRDALRADATLAVRYASLKRELADRFAGDREAYTDAKSDFIREALARHS